MNVHHSPDAPHLDTSPWPSVCLGAALGFTGGMLDYLLIQALDVQMFIEGGDVTLGVVVCFASNFALLGGLIGWLRVQRLALQRRNARIEAQKDTLLARERALIEERALATLGRLSSGVAHEVRNPLAIIRASASLIVEEISPPQRSHEVACFIRDEVDRLDGFVARLMDFTRPLTPQPREFPLTGLLTRVLDIAHAHLRIRAHEITILTPHIAPTLTCHGDEDLLERQLLIMIHNAIEAAVTHVEIRVVPHHDSNRVAHVEIADDGAGVPPNDRPHIFEPFFTTRSSGTGLGLAMAKKIAELHRHTLRYTPGRGVGAEDSGACFTLSWEAR